MNPDMVIFFTFCCVTSNCYESSLFLWQLQYTFCGFSDSSRATMDKTVTELCSVTLVSSSTDRMRQRVTIYRFTVVLIYVATCILLHCNVTIIQL